jgi:hypothetical protein
MMENSDMEQRESPEPAEETLIPLEREASETHQLSLEAQQGLRLLLRSSTVASDLRQRVLALLNPRGAPVIAVPDEEFRGLYAVTTEDNYAKPSGEWDQMAAFDQVHGYYVHIAARPITRKR